jgi:hypothetical protein
MTVISSFIPAGHIASSNSRHLINLITTYHHIIFTYVSAQTRSDGPMKPFEYKPLHNPCALLQDTQICDGGQLAIHLEPLAGHGKRLISIRAVLYLSPSRASMYGNRHVRYLTKFDDVPCHIFSIPHLRIFGISNGKSGNRMKLIKSYIHGCQRTVRGNPR